MTGDFKRVDGLAEFLDVFVRGYDTFYNQFREAVTSSGSSDSSHAAFDALLWGSALVAKHQNSLQEYREYMTPAVEAAQQNFKNFEVTLCKLVENTYQALEDTFVWLDFESISRKRPHKEIEEDARQVAQHYKVLSQVAVSLPVGFRGKEVRKYHEFLNATDALDHLLQEISTRQPPLTNKESFRKYAQDITTELTRVAPNTFSVRQSPLFTENGLWKRYQHFIAELAFIQKNFEEIGHYVGMLQDTTAFMKCLSDTKPFDFPRVDNIPEFNTVSCVIPLVQAYRTEQARVEPLPVVAREYPETQNLYILRKVAEFCDTVTSVKKHTQQLEKILHGATIATQQVHEIAHASSGYHDYLRMARHVPKSTMKKRAIAQAMYRQELYEQGPLFAHFFELLRDASQKIADKYARDFIVETKKYRGKVDETAQQYQQWIASVEKYVPIKQRKSIMRFAAFVHDLAERNGVYPAALQDYFNSDMSERALERVRDHAVDHINDVERFTQRARKRHPFFFPGFSKGTYNAHAVAELCPWMQLYAELDTALHHHKEYQQKSNEVNVAIGDMRKLGERLDVAGGVAQPTMPYLEQLVAAQKAAEVQAPETPQNMYFNHRVAEYQRTAEMVKRKVEGLIDMAKGTLRNEVSETVQTITQDPLRDIVAVKEFRSRLDGLDRKLTFLGDMSQQSTLEHYRSYLTQKIREYNSGKMAVA